MSRNFTADVDTQREYFNASYFNQTGQNQIAKYDTTLLKPLFNDPDKWKLAINRFRIPLSGIPLTKNNIPFETWEVGVGYQPSANDWTTSYSYVPQYNPQTTSNINQLNGINYLGNSYTYLSNSGFTQTSTNFTSGNVFGYINATGMDWSNPSGTPYSYLYVITDNGNIKVYNSSSGAVILHQIAPSGTQYLNLCANRVTGDFFVTEIVNGSNVIQKFTRNGNTFTPEVAGFTLPIVPTQNTSIAYTNGFIYFCAGENPTYDVVVYQYTSGNPNPINTYNLNIVNEPNGPPPNVISDGTYLYISCFGSTGNVAEIVKYNTSLQIQEQASVFTYLANGIPSQQLLGFDQSGNILLSSINANYSSNIIALNSSTFQLVYSTPDPQGNAEDTQTFLIYPKPLVLTPIDSGPYDIFTYQAYLNKINDAFNTAYLAIKAQKGASFLPTEPPRIIYDATTKLFSIIVEGQYLTLNSDGSNQYKIAMNSALWEKFYFPYTENSPQSDIYTLLLQNNGINAIQGTGSQTLPQYISVQQEDSTIYQFFDLTRIIVGTTMIPVSGDADARTFSNNTTTSNSSITMITDVVPDTSTLTNSSALIYIPAGVLRWYNLYAQQPFSRIDIIMYYETKDGNIYPIQIPNAEYFSVKLEFKKGLGDF